MDLKSPPSVYSSWLFNHSGPSKCRRRNRNPGHLSSSGEEVNPYHLASTISINPPEREVAIIRLPTTMGSALLFLLPLSSLFPLSIKSLLRLRAGGLTVAVSQEAQSIQLIVKLAIVVSVPTSI